MKILIIGGNGMLGHQLCLKLSRRMEVWATVRGNPSEYTEFKFLPSQHLLGELSVQDGSALRAVIEKIQPQVVINAAGIVKQRDEAKQAIPSITVNALFPHQLADLCAEYGIRVIQISTDCVFSGLRGNYSEVDNPDPADLYGRSKLIGELNRPGCLTLRTSIIGWELSKFSSLLSWFAAQRGKTIKGYKKAIYSGFSTAVLSVLIGDLIETRSDLYGMYHVASEPISKFDLLVKMREALGWKDILIEGDEQFFCDRSLNSVRFSTVTGWRAPTWDEMVVGLASEWENYAQFYKS